MQYVHIIKKKQLVPLATNAKVTVIRGPAPRSYCPRTCKYSPISPLFAMEMNRQYGGGPEVSDR